MKYLLLILAVVALASCENVKDSTNSNTTEHGAYFRASRLNSDVTFIVNVDIDLADIYAVGDTVWIWKPSISSSAPRICSECTFSTEVDTDNFFKAVLK